MKKVFSNLIILSVFLFSLFVFVSPSANAQTATNIDACSNYNPADATGLNVSTSAIYTLNKSIYMSTLNASDSDCIFIYANNAILDCNNFNISYNGTIDGQFAAITVKNATTFSNITIKNCGIWNFREGIRVANVSNLSIYNNSIFGNATGSSPLAANNASIRITNVSYTNISKNNIYNVSGWGIILNTTLTNVSVLNNVINLTAGGMLFIGDVNLNPSVAANQFNVSFNTIGNITNVAINVSIMNATVRGNNLYNYTTGIYVAGANNSLIDNIIAGAGLGKQGIVISNSSNIVSNNVVNNNTWVGIAILSNRASFLGNNLITANHVFDNVGAGIVVNGTTADYFGNNNISLNRVYNHRGTPGAGIFVNQSAENNTNATFIYDNVFVGNNSYGIYFLNAGNGNLTNNTVTNNSIRGIYFYNSTKNEVRLNNILNNTYGLYLFVSYATNISLNNFTNNSLSQLYLNRSNITTLNRSIASGVSNFIGTINLSNSSDMFLVDYINSFKQTDQTNFTFFNASNVSLRVSSDTGLEGTTTTTCQAGSTYVCQLVSNMVVMGNTSDTPRVFNLTIYYNESLVIANNFVEGQVQIAKYNGGWEEIGPVFVNATGNYVTLLGPLHNNSVYAAVAIKTNSTTSSTSSTGSSGSGGSSSGSGSSSSTTVQKTTTASISRTEEGKEASFSFNTASSVVEEVSFTAGDTILSAKMTVSEVNQEEVSTKVSDLSSRAQNTKVYKYLKFDKQNFDNSDISGTAKVSYSVDKSWLTDQGLEKSEVSLYRINDETNAVERYQGSISKETDKKVFYTSEVPGFSYFVIAGPGLDGQQVEQPTQPSEPVVQPEGEQDDSEEAQTKGKTLLIVVLIIIILAAIIYGVLRYRRKGH